MPIPVLMITQTEYDSILDRLATLEAALPARSTETDGLALRVQSLESTLSAYSKRMAELPQPTKRGSPL